jgi:hypothetical protein
MKGQQGSRGKVGDVNGLLFLSVQSPDDSKKGVYQVPYRSSFWRLRMGRSLKPSHDERPHPMLGMSGQKKVGFFSFRL